MVEILKQKQYSPMPTENQICIIFAGLNGYLDDVNIDRIEEFENGLLDYMRSSHKEILESIQSTGKIDDTQTENLKNAVKVFSDGFDK